ncbi:MAG: 6-carboxytetrahydropterin synthase [Bacteroidales bacterium]|jgi:6-pyruvoyltetrahydropterin/6-carboxytetrahydropterin synthase|nr:6-carboxytetrahydropterin synthase [Bacteroidales bacterium]
MALLRLTRVFNFDMAHVLLNYPGKCNNIHGHTYRLEVTVRGTLCNDETSPKKGMIIDFSDFNDLIQSKIIDVWDHALIIHQNSDPALLNALKNNYKKIIITAFQPTTENMVCELASIIKQILPSDLQLFSLKLCETDKSYIEWYALENID